MKVKLHPRAERDLLAVAEFYAREGSPAIARRFFRDFSPGDEFYEHLIDAHNGLSDEQSEALNARLILLLANHIGDLKVLREALQAARQTD